MSRVLTDGKERPVENSEGRVNTEYSQYRDLGRYKFDMFKNSEASVVGHRAF